MMQFDLPHQLNELARSAGRLNLEIDSVNDSIENFEDALRRLNVGVPVWAPTPILCEPVEVFEWRTYLGWDKKFLGGSSRPRHNWRLVVWMRGFRKDNNREVPP